MSKLPPETLARIEREAVKKYPWVSQSPNPIPYERSGYKAGAQREAELAMDLVEALEWIECKHNIDFVDSKKSEVAHRALAKYRSGGMK